MMNIFENVKFGDKFLTGDGRIAIYVGCIEQLYRLIPEDEIDVMYWYHSDGTIDSINCEEYDIVSKYQETIDELPEQLCSENNSYRERYKAAVNNAKDWIKSHTQSVAYLSSLVSSITIPLYGNEYTELFEKENITMKE